MASLHLALDPDADHLLGTDPLALLIGMVLDQQVPMERAFAAPWELRRRLGGRLDAATVATMDPEALQAVFAERPALHRFPGSMARRVQELCRVVVADFGGDARQVWAGVDSGRALVQRLEALPGFGRQKARIFGALLGKQLGVHPEGWEAATAPYGEPGVFRSVADIVDDASLAAVRAGKAAAKGAARSAATKASATSTTSQAATGSTATKPGARSTRGKAGATRT